MPAYFPNIHRAEKIDSMMKVNSVAKGTICTNRKKAQCTTRSPRFLECLFTNGRQLLSSLKISSNGQDFLLLICFHLGKCPN